ncbi:hypothetical protein ASA1KI_05320 [Opitutales bacterium ASA1]|uniref:hypothetical protein n=1 Tax=Congregicoccus parvus TaxID=3081749 RepID=UPI002B2A2ADE|nr:hypothetical protein ASA1KI_05320 [Opitutales bacterium ASA1]
MLLLEKLHWSRHHAEASAPPRAAAATRRRPWWSPHPNWILVAIGAILVVASTRGPLLIGSGERTLGRVTSVTEVTSVGEYPNTSSLVGFVYTSRDGATHDGTYSLTPVASTHVPAVGDPVAVRYLRSLPGLYSTDSAAELIGLSVVALLSGLVLAFFGFRRGLE